MVREFIVAQVKSSHFCALLETRRNLLFCVLENWRPPVEAGRSEGLGYISEDLALWLGVRGLRLGSVVLDAGEWRSPKMLKGLPEWVHQVEVGLPLPAAALCTTRSD